MDPKPDAVSEPLAAPPRRRARPRPLVLLAGVIVVGGLIYGGYRWYSAGKESTDDAAIDADVVPIAVRVGGPVARVAVSEHQRVKRGDVLVELDPTDFQLRVRQAEADLAAAVAQARAADAQVAIVEGSSRGGLASAEASLAGTQAGVRSAAAELAAARALVARATADRTQAELELARVKRLRASNAATEVDLERAQASFAEADAGVAQAQAQVDADLEQQHVAHSRVTEAEGRVGQSAPVDAQLEVARASAALAHAHVDSAKAAVDQARQQVSYATVRAPSDGLASRLAVVAGQTVAAGQSLLYLVPTTSYVVANFKETQIGQLRPGLAAEIEVDAYPGRTLHGKVGSISPATGARFSLMPPDNATGNFVKVVQRVPVQIEWVDPPADLELLPGMSVTVTVRIE